MLPVGIKYGGIVDVQFHGIEFILLSSLVGKVMSKTASKNYLCVIVDIAANLKYMINNMVKLSSSYN